MTRLRARFDGKVLVPVDPVDLPQGRILDVQVSETDSVTGSAEAILSAVRAAPRVDPETVDDLERGIAAGKLRVRYNGAFDGGD